MAKKTVKKSPAPKAAKKAVTKGVVKSTGKPTKKVATAKKVAAKSPANAVKKSIPAKNTPLKKTSVASPAPASKAKSKSGKTTATQSQKSPSKAVKKQPVKSKASGAASVKKGNSAQAQVVTAAKKAAPIVESKLDKAQSKSPKKNSKDTPAVVTRSAVTTKKSAPTFSPAAPAAPKSSKSKSVAKPASKSPKERASENDDEDPNKDFTPYKPVQEAQEQVIDKSGWLTRTKFNDSELQEFRDIINRKLLKAVNDYELLKDTISHRDNNGTDDTSPTFKLLEDGSEVMSKEETTQLALRQQKYIQALENALIRIENKTYGICRGTGQMISKERLKSVPHATLSIEAKKSQQD